MLSLSLRCIIICVAIEEIENRYSVITAQVESREGRVKPEAQPSDLHVSFLEYSFNIPRVHYQTITARNELFYFNLL